MNLLLIRKEASPLLRKLTPGSEDYYKALNASSEERKELYKKYGIA